VVETVTPCPDLRALWLLVPLGLMWMGTTLLGVLEAQQLVVVTMFQSIALAVLGWRAYRGMLLPLLYLFFLVPSGYFLVPYLQDFTAVVAIWGLKLAGVPVYSDGVFIDIPAGNFVIAEACAGLRFLIASVAFGVFFAGLMYRSRVRQAAFVALSVIVPIIANCIRAWGIMALAEWTNAAQAIEADHVIYGWGFFTVVTLLLIVVGMQFSDEARDEGALAVPDARPAPGMARLALAVVAGLVIAGIGPAYAELRDWRSASGSFAGAVLPPPAAPWTASATRPVDWKPTVAGPDLVFFDAFHDGSAAVLRFVALYKTTGFHSNLVRGGNQMGDDADWTVAKTGRAQVEIGGRPATIATTEVQGEGHHLVIWHFYVVDGRVIASPAQAKLAQLRDFMGGGDKVAAFVVLATERTANGVPPQQVLQDFLTAMGPPAAYPRGAELR